MKVIQLKSSASSNIALISSIVCLKVASSTWVGVKVEKPNFRSFFFHKVSSLFEVTLPLSSLGKSVENLTAVPKL